MYSQECLEILKELKSLQARFDSIEANRKPERIALPDFCKERNISRPTCYAWAYRGLIKLEKIAGRQFVLASSVTIQNKYQRPNLS